MKRFALPGIIIILMLSFMRTAPAGDKPIVDTPLIVAVMKNDLGAVKGFLAAGGEPGARCRQGFSLLSYAVDHGREEIVKLLIAKGADVNSEEPTGDRVIWFAVDRGHLGITKLLADKGADLRVIGKSRVFYGMTLLHIAARRGHASIAAYLLDRGLPVDVEDEWGKRTPLHIACGGGHSEVVRILMARGADTGKKDRFGTTVFHEACGGGLLWLVQDLVKKGADVNAPKPQAGYTPLHCAAWSGRHEVAAFLIDKGARLNTRAGINVNQWTPLHTAVAGGNMFSEEHRLTVKLLLEKGARMDETTAPTSSCSFCEYDSACTALHMAASRGKAEIARLLIQAGADVNARTKQGRTPYDIAHRYPGTRDLIEKAGGKPGKGKP